MPVVYLCCAYVSRARLFRNFIATSVRIVLRRSCIYRRAKCLLSVPADIKA
jgi:hypothetical protein